MTGIIVADAIKRILSQDQSQEYTGPFYDEDGFPGCPDCFVPLDEEEKHWECPGCGRTWKRCCSGGICSGNCSQHEE